eukprot:6102332-Alexandrium_andersonii.AAC.1
MHSHVHFDITRARPDTARKGIAKPSRSRFPMSAERCSRTVSYSDWPAALFQTGLRRRGWRGALLVHARLPFRTQASCRRIFC